MEGDFEKNLSIAMERFPCVGLFHLRLNPSLMLNNKKINFNYRLLMNDISENVSIIYLYGTGYEAKKILSFVKKNKNKRLILLEDDPENFSLFLHSFFAKEVLSHPQVCLSILFDPIERIINDLAESYPDENIEVLCCKGKKIKSFLYIKKVILEKTTFLNIIF